MFCGVNTGLPGFSSADDKGNWSGFDVDFCRAIAAAIFDDPNKVKFIPLDAKERFTELQQAQGRRAGAQLDLDHVARDRLRAAFRRRVVLRRPGLHGAAARARSIPRLELDGSKVCVQRDTTTELNLDDYFRANNMKYEAVKFAKVDDVFKAYESGQCDTLTADVSQLYALRQKLAKPGDHIILPDVISKEPLAPVVRQKDDDWLLIVKWTLFAMLNAEELGINSKNIDQALKSKKPDVMRFVGTEGDYGEDLGLTNDWAVRIIRRVGNYGEVYERNVGTGSKLGIPRGLNQLWNAGGILYAPPIR